MLFSNRTLASKSVEPALEAIKHRLERYHFSFACMSLIRTLTLLFCTQAWSWGDHDQFYPWGTIPNKFPKSFPLVTVCAQTYLQGTYRLAGIKNHCICTECTWVSQFGVAMIIKLVTQENGWGCWSNDSWRGLKGGVRETLLQTSQRQ